MCGLIYIYIKPQFNKGKTHIPNLFIYLLFFYIYQIYMGLVKETEAFRTGQNHWLGADYSFV